jgi:hypothetical protein
VATLFAIVTELDVSLDALFDHRRRASGRGPRPQADLAEVIVRDEGREQLDPAS